jgi:hypothetical protein
MPEPIIDPQRFQVIQAQIEDGRRLIATLKVQRWEVLKWAVALNVGLVTAWVALDRPPPFIFTGLALGVALAALLLILHYNKRAVGARKDLNHTFSLLEAVIKPEERRREGRPDNKRFFHDGWELLIFTLVLLGTVVVTYTVTAYGG